MVVSRIERRVRGKRGRGGKEGKVHFIMYCPGRSDGKRFLVFTTGYQR